MIKYTKKKIEETRNILTSIVCDVCGRDIPANKWTNGKPKYCTEKFMRVTTGHHDWGNDSIDSIETHQICSPECMDEFIKGFYENFTRNKESGTDYIEIESETVWIDTTGENNA